MLEGLSVASALAYSLAVAGQAQSKSLIKTPLAIEKAGLIDDILFEKTLVITKNRMCV